MQMSYFRYRMILENVQSKWSLFNSSNAGKGVFARQTSFRSTNWKVNYAGLAKYGRGSDSSKALHHTFPKFKCFNCGEEGCRVKSCKEPINLERVSKNMAGFRADKRSRTHLTDAFFELCQVLITAGRERSITITQNGNDSDTAKQDFGSESSTPTGNANHIRFEHDIKTNDTLFDAT